MNNAASHSSGGEDFGAGAESINMVQMSDSPKQPQDAVVRMSGARSALQLLLMTVCFGVFIAYLLVLTRSAAVDPLAPLRNVRQAAWGVGLVFGVCLVSTAVFSYWTRRQRQARS